MKINKFYRKLVKKCLICLNKKLVLVKNNLNMKYLA